MRVITQVLLSLSVALFGGLALSRLAKKMHLPAVTAYLIAGILIGPFVLGSLGVPGLGFVSLDELEDKDSVYSILCDLALGFIAFSIGNEFRLSQLKKIGKQATIVGIVQAVFTTIVVDLLLVGLYFLNLIDLPAAIVLGAVASATAPAATLMVVRQYKAKGPVTDILLPVVALDDAVGLVLFAISFGVAKSICLGNVDILSVVLEPLLEVVLSLALGFVMGILFTFMERFFHSRSKRLAVSVTFVMITVALSNLTFEPGGVHIGFSSLLSCMMLGTIFCNTCDFSEELMGRVDRWTAPLFVLFFVISGAELDFRVFAAPTVILVGIVYILGRSAGKYFGANLSSRLSGCDEKIVKYLGITLLPQAGVALGMAAQAMELGESGAMVQSITLFAVLVYEIVGPFLTKVALTKAGDIRPEGKTSARHDAIIESLTAGKE